MFVLLLDTRGEPLLKGGEQALGYDLNNVATRLYDSQLRTSHRYPTNIVCRKQWLAS